MSTDNTDIADRTASCVACLEPIRQRASKCPHCGSSQSPPRWHNFGQVLKWIGGIVTILSLVGGVITLSRFYVDWKERQDAVSEIVGAAEWLIRSENYNQAWDMYRQAAELNPSATAVREGRFLLALKWVRNFYTDPERLDQVLTQLTEILYRGLPRADADLSATILAHIGYIQALRQINDLPIFTDVRALFEQALERDPDNVFANAMFARWLLLARPMTVAQLDRAQPYYKRAIATGLEREHVRRLQFLGIKPYSYGYDVEIEINAMTRLLEICIDMLNNGEGYPDQDTLYKIVDGYGRLGKTEHVEALIAVLPPRSHLEVYEWLIAADESDREIMQQQSTYIRARLNEISGNGEQALTLYRSLFDNELRKEVAALVDRGLERLTGELPARALARNYRNDPVDEANPFQFHLDTLEHFDPKWRSTNLEQALAYFGRQIEQNPQQLTALELGLPTFIQRVRDMVHYGDGILQADAYTSGFGSFDHNNARASWVDLALLQARLLAFRNRFDQALAELGDVARAIHALDDNWQPAKALLDYRMASLYAELAQRNNSLDDREQALRLLTRAIDNGVINSKQAGWEEVKAAPFDTLADDPRYRELVRGR